MRISDLRRLVRSVLSESAATMKMEEMWRDESLEASSIEEATEMYAWDLGYQSIKIGMPDKLPSWLLQCGRELNVDVQKHFEEGRETALAG